MSQISASSSINQVLLQALQNAAVDAQAQAQAQAAAATPAASATPVTQATPSADQPVQSAHHRHHGQGAMFKKLEAAVTSALQAAQSDTSADPNKVIQDAIEKFFKDNNITLPAPGANGQPGSVRLNDSDSTQPTGQPAAADKHTRQAFMQMLKTYGVNLQQFRKDFLAAIQDAQSGQVAPSTAFKSFPPGSSVDTTT